MNNILKELADLTNRIGKLAGKIYCEKKNISNPYDFTNAQELSDKLFEIHSNLQNDCYTLAVTIWGDDEDDDS